MVLDPSVDESELRKNLSAKLSVLHQQQEEAQAEQLAESLGLPYINLVLFPINSDVLVRLSKEQSAEAGVVVFYKQGADVRMAAVDPSGEKTKAVVKQVEEKLGYKVAMYAVSPRSLKAALARYPERIREEKPEDEIRVKEEEISALEQAVHTLEDIGSRITSLPPTEILNTIVVSAVQVGASDIHIEPKEKEARLRLRIDGVLQDVVAFDREGWALLLSRIKVLSNLKLNVHEVPQDGSFVLRIGNETYDMRVSVLPGGYGENIVIRLLDRKSEAVEMADLGMKERDLKVVREELKRSNGMVLITGPTGSGKTTTLASFLREVNKPELKVITLEDPIEYRIAGIEQTQVNADAGYTFAKGLRSILRQDPDVIMVGEMRDTETAETAVHAALTGHLVFSTLHTNNAAGAVPRLSDMNVKPFVLGPALNLVIAQRLVRNVCHECAEKYTPTNDQLEDMQDVMRGVRVEVFDPSILKRKDLVFLRAKGCEACGMTGYKGRVGVFEIFSVHGEIEELVLKGTDSQRIQEAALKQGMTTIAQDAYMKVIDQITTIEEVERISEE